MNELKTLTSLREAVPATVAAAVAISEALESIPRSVFAFLRYVQGKPQKAQIIHSLGKHALQISVSSDGDQYLRKTEWGCYFLDDYVYGSGRIDDLSKNTDLVILDLAQAGAISNLYMQSILARGFNVSLIQHWSSQRTSFTQSELAASLRVTLRTYQRWLDGENHVLTPSQSEGFAYMEHVYQRARVVFGSDEEAHTWLRKPSVLLDSRKPIDLMGTAIGAQLVLDLLTRIEYGVLA